MNAKQCGTCAFYTFDQCRRKPPSNGRREGQEWPFVGSDDFCGEWKPAQDLKEREAFFSKLVARLDLGAEEYGSKSFDRPEAELRAEIEEEVLDIAGWAYVLWVRLRRLREARKKKHGKETSA